MTCKPASPLIARAAPVVRTLFVFLGIVLGFFVAEVSHAQTATPLPSGTVGQAYSFQVTTDPAAGSDTVYGALNLPPGLAINVATGLVSGTPIVAGSYAGTISLLSGGETNNFDVTIAVNPPTGTLSITSATSASATVGMAFNYQVQSSVVVGAPRTSFNLAALPPGLLGNSATGAISGTPTAVGIYPVELSANNLNGPGPVSILTITVAPSSAAPVISGAASATVPVNGVFNYSIVASNSPTSYAAVGLPFGLSLNPATGTISGTPTVPGGSVVGLTATNAAGTSAVFNLTIVVGAVPVISSASAASVVLGNSFAFGVAATNSPVSFNITGLPAGLTANTTTGAITGLPAAAGVYAITLSATNANGTGPESTLTLTVAAAGPIVPPPVIAPPTITTQPVSQAVSAGGNATFSVTATGTGPFTYQWRKNGAPILGATGSSYTLTNFAVTQAGSYSVDVSNSGGTTRSRSAAAGFVSTAKVAGNATEVGMNIEHPNGNIYDQILLTGASAAITADPGQITRISFLDLNDDIIQVEFSGAGTLTLTLDGATGPAAPVKYNQPGVTYMKGHASLVITGADETSNLSIFSVGTLTAVNQALFPPGMTYDAIADIGLISISSVNGKFGGIRAANASFFQSMGLTGINAPGVAVQGPTYLGDLSAQGDATGVLIFGSTSDVRVTGGDLMQLNNRAIQVDGITQIRFTAGTTSAGQIQPIQANRARLEKNGADMTSQIILP